MDQKPQDQQPTTSPEMEQPTAAPTEPAPQPTPPKKSRKWLYVVLGVVLAAALAVAAYVYWPQNNDTQDSANNTQDTVQEEDSKAIAHAELENFMKSVEEQLKKEFADTPTAEVNRYADHHAGPAYKEDPNEDFYAMTEQKGMELSVSDSESTSGTFIDELFERTEAVATKELEKHNFKVTEQPGEYRESTEYQNDNLICNLSKQAMHLICAAKLDYPSADELRPFVVAMKKHDDFKDAKSPIVLDLPKVQVSQTEGYQIAKASITGIDMIGGVQAQFYKKSSDSEWSYFAAPHQSAPCSNYDTEDLRAAFKGEPCYREGADVADKVS